MHSLPLWKRCRALANSLRLDMLELLNCNSPRCVKEIATELDVAENVASKNLQLLSTAGFVTQKYRGKFLCYALDQGDILLSSVLELTKADENERAMFMATALTHERRVAIVKALKTKPLEIERISLETRISWEAMARQVKKLERRGFVQLEDGKYALRIPKCSFGESLVGLALNEYTPAQV